MGESVSQNFTLFSHIIFNPLKPLLRKIKFYSAPVSRFPFTMAIEFCGNLAITFAQDDLARFALIFSWFNAAVSDI